MIGHIYELLRDKRILILGFGKEGKSTYNFIRNRYPDMELAIYDKKSITDKLDHVVLHSGESFNNILGEYDLIIKSPGIVLGSVNQEILSKITSQTELFLRYYSEQTIGITGTKGKSTTTSLVHHVLSHAGREVLLVGNIGVPVFDVLDKITRDTIVVFELSSHQLEYTNYSPKISVFLNIYQEHLDHYGSYEKYVIAKENIFKHQHEGDVFIYNPEFINPGDSFPAERITISNTSYDTDMFINADVISYKGRTLKIDEDEIQLKGRHNLYDIGAAYVVTDIYGLTVDKFYEAVKTFKPLPHRMEYVAEIEGVKYYNDSISTICETTIQAANSIKNIDTLILGGMDRGIDYEPLADYLITSEIRNFILMPDTGKRINNLLVEKDIQSTSKNIFLASDVREAVNIAKKETRKGMTCLFSPAAASYGFFKNFEERGEVFKSLINNNYQE